MAKHASFSISSLQDRVWTSTDVSPVVRDFPNKVKRNPEENLGGLAGAPARRRRLSHAQLGP